MTREDFGFVTAAFGKVNYLEMAADMALSLKRFHTDPFCLLCDQETARLAKATYTDIFDHIVCPDVTLVHPLASNFLVCDYAPFARGMFIDADILVQSSLQKYIENTLINPVTMMGHWVSRGSNKRHHGILVDQLMDHFGVDVFFSNHSGMFSYQREAGNPFFRHSLEVYEQLWNFHWRLKGHIGNELAFGIAAAQHEVGVMSEPFPVIWPEEMQKMQPGPCAKPLLHFIAALPEDVLNEQMAQIKQRREEAGLPQGSEEHWRKKSLKSQKAQILRKRARTWTERFAKLKTSKTVQKSRVVLTNQMPLEHLQNMSLKFHENQSSTPQKFYFHHLKKCGGTSINKWIDGQFPVYPDNKREIQLKAYSAHEDELIRPIRNRLRLKGYAQKIMEVRDGLHDHAPLARFVPEGTFRFTMLREPEARLWSQIKDWKRLSENDFAHNAPPIKKVIQACIDWPVPKFLSEIHSLPQFALQFTDNHLVRVIAETRVGHGAIGPVDTERLLPIAMEVLQEDFELVGLLEETAGTQRILAEQMGWFPPGDVPHRNATKSSSIPASERQEAKPFIEPLIRHDLRLYELARDLYHQATQASAGYDQDHFERYKAKDSLARLTPHLSVDGIVYHGSDRVFGDGFDGRDVREGLGYLVLRSHSDCTLYIPVPENKPVEAYLALSDINAERLNNNVRFMVDGKRLTPRLVERGANKVDVFLPATAQRPFVRIDIIFEHIATGKRSSDVFHALCDRYGWVRVG